MTRHLTARSALTLGALPLLLAACASYPDSYAPLQQVQADFNQARAADVPQHAPVQFRDAETALNRAETALGNTKEEELRHLTSLAQTQLETAKAEAQRVQAEQDRKRIADARNQQDAMAAAMTAEEERMRRQQAEAELAAFKARQTSAGTVLTLDDVLFDTGSARLQPGAQRRLQPLVNYLRENADRKVTVEGYTDNTGSAELNMNLSRNRADAVRNLLVDSGIDGSRIETRGLGEDYPVASNDTASGRQQNRRIEVTIRNPQQQG